MQSPSNATAAAFAESVRSNLGSRSSYAFDGVGTLSFPLRIHYDLVNASGKYRIGTGSSSDGKVAFESDFKGASIPRFYRVGMVESIPWLFKKIDPATNDVVVDREGRPVYEGYCMDLLAKIAEKLDFAFEVVIAPEGGHRYGRKDEASGEWDGLVGDLARGETDLIVADLTMTSEREEVIDFVSPYFDQAQRTNEPDFLLKH